MIGINNYVTEKYLKKWTMDNNREQHSIKIKYTNKSIKQNKIDLEIQGNHNFSNIRNNLF